MTKKYSYGGESLIYTASGAVLSGAAVIIGTILGVSHQTLANGDQGTMHIEGVFELPKLTAADITQGAMLTWDVSASQFIIASAAIGDLENCAVAVEAAGTSATTVLAKLLPGRGAVKAS